MLQPIDPNRDLKLCLGLAASGALAITPLALPANALTRSIFPVASIAGSIASIAKVNTFEAIDRENEDAKERWQALKADMDDALLVSSQAFYTSNPQAWIQRREVPHQWHEQYLNARFSPLPELPAPQFEPIAQTQPIQQPGQVRGGSFDRAASESPGSGWGDFEPRPVPPIAQTAPTFSAPIASQPQEWEPDAVDLYAPDESWIDSLLRPSVLLVYGSDGSGKTTVACELIARRQAANHQTFALDPHAHPGKWGDCEVIGAGMGHKAIAAFIARLQGIITDRYERISKGEVRPGAFQPISIVCEELTDWSGEVSNSDLLLAKAGHYRKANVHLILVSHGDKLGQLGAPKGFSDMANRILTKLKLESKPGANGEPIPAMKGVLTQPNGQPIPVVIPRFAQHQPEIPAQNPETLAVQRPHPDIADRFGFHETPETTPKRPEMMALPPAETRNTDEPPKGAECRDLFFRLKDLGLNQTQIIKAIWGATPGDSPQYKMARDFYKLLHSQYLKETGDNAA